MKTLSAARALFGGGGKGRIFLAPLLQISRPFKAGCQLSLEGEKKPSASALESESQSVYLDKTVTVPAIQKVLLILIRAGKEKLCFKWLGLSHVRSQPPTAAC